MARPLFNQNPDTQPSQMRMKSTVIFKHGSQLSALETGKNVFPTQRNKFDTFLQYCVEKSLGRALRMYRLPETSR